MSATAVAADTLTRIARLNPAINAFTDILKERALAKAQAIDQTRSQGGPLGPLAGVPFAAKNLFDVAGLSTLAGSKINRERAPATRDATALRRLEAAGAVLVAPSIWANTPMTSPARMCTTGIAATPMTAAEWPEARRAVPPPRLRAV